MLAVLGMIILLGSTNRKELLTCAEASQVKVGLTITGPTAHVARSVEVRAHPQGPNSNLLKVPEMELQGNVYIYIETPVSR